MASPLIEHRLEFKQIDDIHINENASVKKVTCNKIGRESAKKLRSAWRYERY